MRDEACVMHEARASMLLLCIAHAKPVHGAKTSAGILPVCLPTFQTDDRHQEQASFLSS
jgi:hypothetical protein